MVFIPRQWQKECLDRERQSRSLGHSNVFFLEACPAAGKTAMAAMVMKEWLQDGVVDHVLVIAPWLPVQDSIAEECQKMGLDVMKSLFSSSIEYQPPPAHEVTVLTTQSAAKSKIVTAIAEWSIKYNIRFGLVIDEVHHNAQFKKWGQAAENLGLHAKQIMVMSGTPFRPDGLPITFIERHETGVKSDYTLSYEMAVNKQYVRHTTVRWITGKVDLFDATKNETVRKSYDELTSKELSDARNSLFEPSGSLITSAIDIIHKDLMRIRQDARYADAAALFVCRPGFDDGDSDKRVHQIAKRIFQLTGIHATTVTYDDADAEGKLRAFKKGNAPYIVAVNKVSEGVNIPRIVSIAMLRLIDSALLVRQVVGRAIRRRGPWDDIAASIYAPKLSPMSEYLEEIYKEGVEGIKTRIPCEMCGGIPCTCNRECEHCGFYPCDCPKCDDCKQKSWRCRCNKELRYAVVDDDCGATGGRFKDDDVREEFVKKAEEIAFIDSRFHGSNVVQMGALLQAAGLELKEYSTSESFEQRRRRMVDKMERLNQRLAKLKYEGHVAFCFAREIACRWNVETIDTAKASIALDACEDICKHIKDQIEISLRVNSEVRDG